MKSFENKILNDGVINAKAWFGKSKMTKEVVEAMMWPILKYPKLKDESGEPDYTRNPTMKLKIPYWEQVFTLELYNMAGEIQYRPPKEGSWEQHQNSGTPMTLMSKGTHLTGLIQCTGLWFAGGKFGCTWKLLQAKLQSPVRLVGSGVCHILDDSDDDNALEELKAKAEEKEAFVQPNDQYTTTKAPTFGDDSDDDDEDDDYEGKPGDDSKTEYAEIEEEVEEEEVEEVVPPPKKKKKKIIKKKN